MPQGYLLVLTGLDIDSHHSAFTTHQQTNMRKKATLKHSKPKEFSRAPLSTPPLSALHPSCSTRRM